MGGEQVHPDDEFIDKVLFELWKTVFNDSEVVMKDFISFGRQKCKIIFVTERGASTFKIIV